MLLYVSDIRRRLAQLAIAGAADEFFHTPMRVVIRHLNGRMFRKISGRGMQHAALAAIKRKFATADGVDGHACGIW
jgi:hypothetical protein